MRFTEEYSFVKKLRNSVTNHYDLIDAKSKVDKYPEKHRFRLLNSRHYANSFYPASEEIAHLSSLEIDEKVGMTVDRMNAWIARMSAELHAMHMKAVTRIVEQHPFDNGRKVTINIPNYLVADVDTKLPLVYFDGKNSRF